MADAYSEWVDLAFSIIFGIQIVINLVVFIKQVKRREFIIVLVNLLLTVNLIFRFVMTVIQLVNRGNLLENGEYYKYLYFEFPYHLFNVAAFIVLMQWLQLWAVLS